MAVGQPGNCPFVFCGGTRSGLSGVPSGNWYKMVSGSVKVGSSSKSPTRTTPVSVLA
jgi:hypothetical protein